MILGLDPIVQAAAVLPRPFSSLLLAAVWFSYN